MTIPSRRKTAIVTGSSAGIGAATARRFLDDGCNVTLNGRDAATLEAAREDL